MRAGLFLLLCCSAVPAGEALRSPWDLHPVTATDGAYNCPAYTHLPRDLTVDGYYSDGHYSVVDPVRKEAYEKGVAAYNELARSIVRAADRWRMTGNRAAAECAVTLLDSTARDGVLSGTMGSSQAFYVQGWLLGSWAVAWLKVRGSGAATPEQASRITGFLMKLADSTRAWYEDRRRRGSGDSRNNHLYWAGFAVAAAAIASDNRSAFDWGIDTYRQGVADIRADGALPLELGRAGRALHYHLYALAPLVMLAEFGEANGLDLYSEHGFAIRRLVERCVSGLQDPAWFERKTGVVQVMPPRIEAGDIGWAVPWLRRFPDPAIAALLAQVKAPTYTMWGGLPPP